MAFVLPTLDYQYDSLEPHIDAGTMEIHYSGHHAGYLERYNEAIRNTGLETVTPARVFARISEYSEAIRHNGGGSFNHSLFWKILTPNTPNSLEVKLADAITKYFGTLDDLKEEFSRLAAGHFGSGWTWLVKRDNGELVVTTTSNQDNPLMDLTPIRGNPILCLDVWEHAYYLKYRNRKMDYIRAFWNVVNWHQVAKLYNEQTF